jgi:hypothetical protein
MPVVTLLAVAGVVAVVGALPALGQEQQPAATCPCVKKKPPLGERLHDTLKAVPPRLDFALAYDYEWTKASSTTNQNLNLQGGSADVAYNLGAKASHFAIVARATGETANLGQTGFSLSEIRALAGPRFTFGLPPARRIVPHLDVYALALFGWVHGFDGTFPQTSPSGTVAVSSANSFAWQFGGGVHLPLRGGFGIRLVEADYIHQDDVQISAGITYHLSRK